MAKRVTQEEVRDLLETDTNFNVEPFIEMANALTDKISSNDTTGVMTSALLKSVEKNLAAHYYALRDPQYASENTGASSATYQGQTGMGFDYTPWGQAAKDLDLTGFLVGLGKTKPRMNWLGRPPSEQTDYVDRN